MPELDRRDFLKLVGASAGAAAAAGCADHVEKLIPYVIQPEEITPGNPVVYASTCTECSVGCGIHVKTREGRPIKLEGNPNHPINQGRLCGRAQAAVTRTYLPDRIRKPLVRNDAGVLEETTWEVAFGRVGESLRINPSATHFFGGSPGDTVSGLVDTLVTALGGGRTLHEPFAREALRAATQQLFGVASEPIFDVSGASLILDFGSEMLDSGLSPVEHTRQWAQARDIDSHADGGAKLIYVGSRLSLTASSADEWLPARPGSEGILALALARAAIAAGAGGGAHAGLLTTTLANADAATAARETEIPAETIERLGRALAKGRAVALPPGVGATSRRAIGVASAVLLLNQVVGAIGSSVIVPPADTGAAARVHYHEALALIETLKSGQVRTLIVHHANPVYALPKSAGFAEALASVTQLVVIASAQNETTAVAHVVLPEHAPLETWGDVQPRSGVRGLIQPAFAPLYDTKVFGDIVLGIGRIVNPVTQAAMPAEGDFRSLLQAAWAGVDFRAALKAGGSFGPAASAAPSFAAAPKIDVDAPVLTGDGELTLVAFPHTLLGDGRGAALPQLQEAADSITSVAWDSWAEISLATADRLGAELGDILRVETPAGAVEVAAFPRGGLRDDVIAIPTGQGHSVGHYASKAGQGLAATARGVNVADLLPSDGVDEAGGRAWLTAKATVTNTGRHRRLPMYQFSDNKRERQLGERVTLASLLGHEEHAEHHGPHEIREPYDPAADANDAQYEATFHEKGEASAKVSDYRWGMAIDIDRCTGCRACVIACYVENNIPVVGEDEVLRVRPMTWLRIDRWVGEGEAVLEAGRVHPSRSREKLGDTDIRNAPIMCQHCGAAPCEPVCPVIATYHNEEGLNAMVYNRCIGARYCANNCPYKVRRFNYFDNQIVNWPEPMELGLNPDVTVRGQGVMEKCTFCVQRIQYERQQAKHRGEKIADGAVVTACQQTCPSSAITFGNLRDAASAVSQKAASKRGYHALHALNTRPAVTYLSKVTRGPVQG